MSRVMTRRSNFSKIQYQDLRASSGYAYEDWHLNVEAVGHGFEVNVARNTTIYYRQRANSLLKEADSRSVRTIPPARFFNPEVYLEVCREDYFKFSRGERHSVDQLDVRSDFMSSQVNIHSAHKANFIDSAIDISVINHIPALTNHESDLSAGAAYFEIARELKGKSFTDVALFPFMTTGGGEKYILNVLNCLVEVNPDRKLLLISGQGGVRHKWIEKLPAGSVFIDIFNRYPNLTNEHRDLITLKIIQSVAPTAVLHLKCSEYAQDFYSRYSAVLENFNVFYRFSDQIRRFEDRFFVNGYSWDFISDNIKTLDLVICDNHKIMRNDVARIDTLAEKEVCLYTLCEIEKVPIPKKVVQRRILWASRLDPEKRPELIGMIAAILESRHPDVVIDVWGESFSGFDVAALAQHRNIQVRGSYSGFTSIGTDQYDMFLYTSAYDGLPNVVVEAMACSLPVIAPDIGGISEAVINHVTGVLIDGARKDEELVTSYVAAIDWLYDEDGRIEAVGNRALHHVQANHSREAYRRQVCEIFKIASNELQDI
ncbi:hypothetical protein DK412_14800 [Methylobacterium sp. 17Sr1-1]|nr:hypothetical protein DK412_14800 [Methylobacterium sp. 17Sr1-1]